MQIDRNLRDQWKQDGDVWRMTLPEGWMQGRAVFGALTTAAAAGLAIRATGGERAVRSVGAQLLGPVLPGPLTGLCNVLREGKNVTFVEVRLQQADKTLAVIQVVLVNPRAGSVTIAPAPRWEGLAPDASKEMPFISGMTPEFTKHLQVRWATGNFPFTGEDEAKLTGYCRTREPSSGVEGLLALIDVWPCPTLSTLTKPAFASTVTWNAHIIEVPDDLSGWFAFEYTTIVGRDGFHTAAGRLHAPDGRLVAWTEQLYAIFD
ncbi:MAG: acyl-CoA thioesterase [Myxococcota bacterium]|jgi:acyl-CoA thioesterase